MACPLVPAGGVPLTRLDEPPQCPLLAWKVWPLHASPCRRRNCFVDEDEDEEHDSWFCSSLAMSRLLVVYVQKWARQTHIFGTLQSVPLSATTPQPRVSQSGDRDNFDSQLKAHKFRFARQGEHTSALALSQSNSTRLGTSLQSPRAALLAPSRSRLSVKLACIEGRRCLEPDNSLKVFYPPQNQALLVDWIWEHPRKGAGRGCLDSAGISAGRLSMSGYEKPQDSYVYGYTPTRSSQEQSYPGLSQPSFDPQYPSSQANTSQAVSSTHQMPYLGQPFEPRDTAFQAASSAPLIEARSRSSPEIISTGPFSGIANEIFRLKFRSLIDYSSQSNSFFLMFGSAVSKAALTKNYHLDPYYHYTLEARIPSFASTKASDGTMPLLLEVLGENSQPMTMKTLENFTYLDLSPFSGYSPPLQQKKRKYTDDSTGYGPVSSKRVAAQPLQTRSSSMYPPNTDPIMYNNSNNNHYESSLYSLPSAYDRSLAPQRSFMQPIAQKPSYQYTPSPHRRASMAERTPSVGGYSSYSNARHLSHSPQTTSTPRTSLAHIEAATTANAPRLIRTSTLQPQSTSTAHNPSFNPHALFNSSKAEIDIQGDLQAMCNGWTQEELKAKRRLVEFQRSQEGSIITTSFRPVTLEERTPNSPCISCIWWEEQNRYYVTSVDTIQLLESLVGVRFTVEEKNRIRRNLEGYKPMTISKQKEDCESFFRLIMGFPNPKPRNIEKDVKVFLWSNLEIALRKIIGKYSMTSTPMTSTLSGHIGLEVTAGAYDPPRNLAHPQSTMGQWQTQYPPVSGISHYAPGPSPSARSSWEMHPYAGQGSPVTAAETAQHVQYYPGEAPSEHLRSPDSNPYPPHGQPTSHS
ncbi:hypothetical protein FKW77_006526 [Venturia effusa]|uniref:DUF7082 domain-containing protein n=1 Tax=Venturia effusa TaxID=50376 RepID=A0A517L5J1_9PEZI|nr:hypothetical protein FKW77_006526 [Venturia effusa]